MPGGRVMEVDLPLAAKCFELKADKLGTIIVDQNSQKFKMTDDVFLDKLNHIHIFNTGIRLSFYPL